MKNIFFESWESLFGIIIVTFLAYVALMLFLRASGKRTLSKMNAFDFVVTIALGSILGTVALDADIPLADGLTALLAFIAFQYLFTWLSARVNWIQTLITSRPTLIFYKGNFLHSVMKKERVTEEEIYSAARQKSHATLEGIDIIILETTGDISIIKKIINHEDAIYNGVDLTP